MRRNWIFWALLVLPAVCMGQDSSSGLNARALFYREQQDNDKLPPVPATRPAAKKTSPPAAKPEKQTTTAKATPEPEGTHDGAAIVPVSMAVGHLGLRYNILLVDSQGNATPVDPDRNFHPADCVQIEFFPNRSGYLYVIEQGSSKKWQPLLPSPDMPDEANIARSYTTMRVPQKYCFEVGGPPGDERFFIVLSRNPEDIWDLHDAIKNGRTSAPAPATSAPASSTAVLSADNRLDDAIRRVSALQNRDITIKKIAQPEQNDPPQSVYVTNVSDTGSDRLILQITIKHH